MSTSGRCDAGPVVVQAGPTQLSMRVALVAGGPVRRVVVNPDNGRRDRGLNFATAPLVLGQFVPDRVAAGALFVPLMPADHPLTDEPSDAPHDDAPGVVGQVARVHFSTRMRAGSAPPEP